MKKMVIVCFFAYIASVSGVHAASDTLERCIADSTTGKKRKDLARWLVVAMIQHPAMADLGTLPRGRLESSSKTAAAILERLMTSDCRKEFKAAYQTGGRNAVQAGFQHLGRLATAELSTDPRVEAALENFRKYVNEKKIQNAMHE